MRPEIISGKVGNSNTIESEGDPTVPPVTQTLPEYKKINFISIISIGITPSPTAAIVSRSFRTRPANYDTRRFDNRVIATRCQGRDDKRYESSERDSAVSSSRASSAPTSSSSSSAQSPAVWSSASSKRRCPRGSRVAFYSRADVMV